MKTLMTIAIAVLAALSPCRLRAQSVPDFNHEVAISKLSTPVDFTKTVYAETSQAASAGFWLRIDMQSQSPDKAQRVFQLSGSESPKATYKSPLTGKSGPRPWLQNSLIRLGSTRKKALMLTKSPT